MVTFSLLIPPGFEESRHFDERNTVFKLSNLRLATSAAFRGFPGGAGTRTISGVIFL